MKLNQLFETSLRDLARKSPIGYLGFTMKNGKVIIGFDSDDDEAQLVNDATSKIVTINLTIFIGYHDENEKKILNHVISRSKVFMDWVNAQFALSSNENELSAALGKSGFVKPVGFDLHSVQVHLYDIQFHNSAKNQKPLLSDGKNSLLYSKLENDVLDFPLFYASLEKLFTSVGSYSHAAEELLIKHFGNPEDYLELPW